MRVAHSNEPHRTQASGGGGGNVVDVVGATKAVVVVEDRDAGARGATVRDEPPPSHATASTTSATVASSARERTATPLRDAQLGMMPSPGHHRDVDLLGDGAEGNRGLVGRVGDDDRATLVAALA